MNYAEKEIDILKKYYPKGGCAETQKYIKRSRDSIRHKAKSLGITVIDDFMVSKIDVSEFLCPNDPEVAYLLGLLWGDGFVSCKKRSNYVMISLIKNDFDDIRLLFDPKKWKIKDGKNKHNPTWKPYTKAFLYNKYLAQFFKDNDFCEKSKTSPTKILQRIPEIFHFYFFRGWFDADGNNTSLMGKNSTGRLTIAGSFEQDWLELEKLSKKLKLKFSIYRTIGKNGHRYSQFKIQTMDSVKNFMNFVYQGKIFGLSRKLKKYKDYLQYLNDKLNKKSSKFLGVTKTKFNTWFAYVSYNKSLIRVGTYKTEIEAAIAYNLKSKEIKGNKARLNLI